LISKLILPDFIEAQHRDTEEGQSGNTEEAVDKKDRGN